MHLQREKTHHGDVVLVAPPMSKACEPDPGMLVLAGYLGSVGVETRLVDANLHFQLAMFEPTNLASYADQLEARGVSESALTSARRAAGRGPRVWRSLILDETYADARRYRGALDGLFEVFRLASRAMEARITPSDFIWPTLSPLCSADLAAVAREPGLLPTSHLLASSVDRILETEPRLIGVSATYLSQALHAYCLAGKLREAGYDGLLVLGGALVGSWLEKLDPSSAVFEAWDALVAGHGELPLAEMARTSSVADCAGVMAPARGVWRKDGADRGQPVGFFPDGSTLEWGHYLAPSPILPLTASRGCYWARCAFCPEAAVDAQPYRPATPDELARHILDARDRYGAALVHLTDSAVSPSHLRKMARALRGSGIRWYGFARLEKQLAEPGFMQDLADGGCVMLQLGIESASPRLLELNRKGTDLLVASRIIEAAHAASVRVYGYFLFGMATETEEEARLTIDWIRDRGEQLTFLNLAIMNLPMGGEIERMPDAFGVDKLEAMDGRNDLSLYWGFSGDEQQGRVRLRRVVKAARRDPLIRPAVNRTPRGFKSNHAAFVALD